ncbi:MAG: N-acetylglucosamine-6-phosphate deacetylase [Osedax symbiont Rs1]|nr:MAG: N-acetylglucosamine-6-phosphate deacetylase [Osedax symbiont Rs1]
MSFVLTNCQIFTSEQIIKNNSLIIDSGKIANIIPDTMVAELASLSHLEVIDLQGNLLVPGFIDTQVNGGGGVLFNNDPSIDSIAAIGIAHRNYGTTGFLATLISDDLAKMQTAIDASKQALNEKVPGFLGLHLEGPYLNTIRRGVHSETKLRTPDQESLKQLLQLRNIGSSMVTLAPEMVAAGFIKSVAQAGIIVSVGHSNASYDCIRQALLDGVSSFTHLFNAMSPLTSREPGVVGAALEDPDSWCGLIVDNHHVHPATLKIAIKAKAPGKMLLVSDAVHTVGATGSEFNLAGTRIYRKDGKVTTAEGTLAGSDLDMASAVRNTVQLLQLPLEEALRMASLYPAQLLKLADQLGRIQQGYRADLVLLDTELNVIETWINGESSKRC